MFWLSDFWDCVWLRWECQEVTLKSKMWRRKRRRLLQHWICRSRSVSLQVCINCVKYFTAHYSIRTWLAWAARVHLSAEWYDFSWFAMYTALPLSPPYLLSSQCWSPYKVCIIIVVIAITTFSLTAFFQRLLHVTSGHCRSHREEHSRLQMRDFL